MADEPSLPRMPPATAADAALFGRARKRFRLDGSSGGGNESTQHHHQQQQQQHLPLLLNNSSDPAVFSSDDDPALDNYAATGAVPGQPRRKKKRYVGAWFAQHPASTDSAFDGGEGSDGTTTTTMRQQQLLQQDLLSSPPRPRKRISLARQFDSGVWMDSGGTVGGGQGEGDDADADADGNPLPDCAEDDELLDEALADARASSSTSSASASSSPLSLVAAAVPPETTHMSPSSSPPRPRPPHQTNLLLLRPPQPQPQPPPPPPRQRRVFQRVPSLAVDPAEAKARATIQACIEAGDEEVSLIGLGLSTLSDATVEPLSGLVPIPVVAPGVAFEQTDPQLKLFLSSNALTRLPGALCALQHLTVLSLRGNALTELPPALGQLTRLRSLNVSLNALRWLPAALLPLLPATGQGGTLTELLAHPNPFVAREEGEEGSDHHDDDAAAAAAIAAAHRMARSPVCYHDATGQTLSAFSLGSSPPSSPSTVAASATHGDADAGTGNGIGIGTGHLPTEDMRVPPVPPLGWSERKKSHRPARVPTLMACALAACYRAPQLAQLPALLPPDAPSHLARQLVRAQTIRDAGGAACDVCGRRPLVAPLTEWVEWWTLNPQGAVQTKTASATSTVTVTETLPFVWRGCSWGCVPQTDKTKSAP